MQAVSAGVAVAAERSLEGAILPDEVIEFWAGVYLANPALARAGVTFERFLCSPMAILRSAAAWDRRMAARTAAAAAADSELYLAVLERERGWRNAGGRWIEKLRHRALPKKSAADRRAPPAKRAGA
jgi:hypothetical protein